MTGINSLHKNATSKLIHTVVLHLARYLLPRGFGYGDFAEVSKKAFSHAAEDQMNQRGDRPTNSRIAAITGLSRAEIARIKKLDGLHTSNGKHQRTERVMHGWYTDPTFNDANGSPRILDIQGAGSFSLLVKRYSGDIPTKAVLNELKASSMIRVLPDGRLEALRRHYLVESKDQPDTENITMNADIFLRSLGSDKSISETSSGRVSVDFSGPIPTSVRRTIATRITRFLDGLSDYINGESQKHQDRENLSPDRSSQIDIIIVKSELSKK